VTKPLVETKDAIENAIGWLKAAEAFATEDPDFCDHVPALNKLANRIGGALAVLESLLPLAPELEAMRLEEWHADDGYESPEAMGLGYPR
jgi:hypothetical protein